MEQQGRHVLALETHQRSRRKTVTHRLDPIVKVPFGFGTGYGIDRMLSNWTIGTEEERFVSIIPSQSGVTEATSEAFRGTTCESKQREHVELGETKM